MNSFIRVYLAVRVMVSKLQNPFNHKKEFIFTAKTLQITFPAHLGIRGNILASLSFVPKIRSTKTLQGLKTA
ncbi:MAG: hypothetical protein QXK44_00005 [Archaeoglobaceae archaeon]